MNLQIETTINDSANLQGFKPHTIINNQSSQSQTSVLGFDGWFFSPKPINKNALNGREGTGLDPICYFMEISQEQYKDKISQELYLTSLIDACEASSPDKEIQEISVKALEGFKNLGFIDDKFTRDRNIWFLNFTDVPVTKGLQQKLQTYIAQRLIEKGQLVHNRGITSLSSKWGGVPALYEGSKNVPFDKDEFLKALPQKGASNYDEQIERLITFIKEEDFPEGTAYSDVRMAIITKFAPKEKNYADILVAFNCTNSVLNLTTLQQFMEQYFKQGIDLKTKQQEFTLAFWGGLSKEVDEVRKLTYKTA